MEKLQIEALGHGWYCFKGVPQEHRYIRIDNLKCSTNRRALNQAKKINPNYEYEIKELPEGVK